MTRGPELRKIVDKAVLRQGALNKIGSSGNNSSGGGGGGDNDVNLAIVEKHLAIFPDSKASLAFAVLHDHSMSTIAVNLDDVTLRERK